MVEQNTRTAAVPIWVMQEIEARMAVAKIDKGQIAPTALEVGKDRGRRTG